MQRKIKQVEYIKSPKAIFIFVSICNSPKPKIEHMSEQNFSLTMYVLGGVHNLFSLMVLVSYFLSNHPRFPSGEEIKASFRYSYLYKYLYFKKNVSLYIYASN